MGSGKPEFATCFFAGRNRSLQRHSPPIKTAPAHRRQRTPRPRYSDSRDFSCRGEPRTLSPSSLLSQSRLRHKSSPAAFVPRGKGACQALAGDAGAFHSLAHSFPRRSALPCCVGYADNGFDGSGWGGQWGNDPPPCSGWFSHSLGDSVPNQPGTQGWKKRGIPKTPPPCTAKR